MLKCFETLVFATKLRLIVDRYGEIFALIASLRHFHKTCQSDAYVYLQLSDYRLVDLVWQDPRTQAEKGRIFRKEKKPISPHQCIPTTILFFIGKTIFGAENAAVKRAIQCAFPAVCSPIPMHRNEEEEEEEGEDRLRPSISLASEKA